MLFTKSSVLLLVAAATSAIAQPTAEADITPIDTLAKRWSSVSASLYSTSCETDDHTWELNDDVGRCFTFDEGKDVYSIKRSGLQTGDTGYYAPYCEGDYEWLSDFTGPDCLSRSSGSPFKSFRINANTPQDQPEPSARAVPVAEADEGADDA
ncbi:hypothetical protein BJX70DRAFT_355711 [Aspergillus crustosus]